MNKSLLKIVNNPEGKGGFRKGHSGNPGGRPKAIRHLQELARSQTENAIQTLIDIMKNTRERPSTRISAAIEILNRGWGKAPQAMEIPEIGATSESPERLKARRDKLIEKINLILANHEPTP